MKKRGVTIGIAVVCSAATAMAQSVAGKAPTDIKTAKDDVVIVIGCVAPAADGTHYMLNEAVMAPPPTDKMASDPTIAATGADKTVMSYRLDGGDLKAHVGHKVQITGTKSAQKAGTTDKSSDPAKMDMTAMDHKDVGGTLKVKSVKMIAASCT